MEANFTKAGKYENAVPRMHVPGAYPVSVYGKMSTTGAVTNRIVAPYTVNNYIPVPDAVQMTIVSTSAEDAAGGTGVTKIRIHYLDDTLTPQYEDVIPQGLTPVTTVATDIRFINLIHAVTVGSTKAAVGNVSVTHNSITYGYLGALDTRSSEAIYRVPAGKRLMISGMYAGSSSGTAASSTMVEIFTTQIDSIDLTSNGVFFHHAGVRIQDSSQVVALESPFPVSAGGVAGFTATDDKGADITAGFFGWLENAN